MLSGSLAQQRDIAAEQLKSAAEVVREPEQAATTEKGDMRGVTDLVPAGEAAFVED